MKQSPERRWRLKEFDPANDLLLKKTGMSDLLSRLLAIRGITTVQEAEQFLSPSLSGISDPFLLKGMKSACERISRARRNGEKVCIHGDYDLDGVSSVALLESFFKGIGIDVCHVIPLRLEEGYGLSNDGVDTAVREGAKLLITVDCGITSINEAIYCQSRGVDLIITDHHTPGPELPKAISIINPLQEGCQAPFNSFAGVGLAFKLVIGIRSVLRKEGFFTGTVEPNLREYLDLAALGTIADLVPLLGENRTIASFGLKELSSSRRPGIVALKKVAAVEGPVNSGAVGFRLAPRLNAAGRLDDAERGVELLLSTDPGISAQLAEELDAANGERQEIEREMLEDALAMIEDDKSLLEGFAIVLASEKWHSGVIGIVASRIVEQYHRPTILIAVKDGIGKGSGRSISSFDLHDGIKAASGRLIKFGGHRQAAGLVVNETDIDFFAAEFNAVAARKLSLESLVPILAIDAELKPEEVSPDLVALQERLRPFGMGNPEPVFMLSNVKVVDARILKDLHLKLLLKAGNRDFSAIGFNMAGEAQVGDLLDIAFTADMNIWNNREQLQLKLKGIRKTRSS